MPAKKILLVEDDNNLREIYGARLQAEGYDIVSAPDGENALAVAVKEKPDLIISDVMMPKVSGFDMLDILRNAPETKDTKVIMMTALSQAEDKARADKLGADMYLVKSQVTLEDVTKAVHSILDDPSESTQEAESAAAQAMVSGDSKEKTDSGTGPVPEPPAPPVQPAPEPATPQPPQPPEPSPAPTPQPPAAPVAEPPKPPETVNPAPTPTQPAVAEEPKAPTTDISTQQPTAGPTSIPVNIEGDSEQDAAASSAVTPNLAQALEDEEKAVQEKIKGFEKIEPEPVVQPTIQDQATTNSTPPPAESTPDAPAKKAKDSKPSNLLDDRPAKKIIEPINDPTKGPDIHELVAKEEAKEAAGGTSPDQLNQVIKPDSSANQPIQSPTSSDAHDDDFGKISL